MITKLYIPIIDLSRANFDYGRNLTNEEMANMEYEKFRRTDRQVDNYVTQMQYRKDNRWDVREARNYRRDFSNVIDEDEYVECEAFFADSKKKEVSEEFFSEHDNGRKFIITININPNSLEQEAESELRYWRDDSNGVLNDRTMDNQTKIECLMRRDLGIELGGTRKKLEDCRIIADFSNKDFPYYYGILVSKISDF